MKGIALWLALAWAAPAAIDGTLINRTTGEPAAGVEVRLVRMSAAGPEPVETVKTDGQGRFLFRHMPEAVHYVLEAERDGVTYTRMLAPGAEHRDVELAIYNATRRRGAVSISQRIVFLEPEADALNISETWLLRNDGRLTWHDPASGAFRFFLPEAARGKVSVMVTAPGGMPLPRAAGKARPSGWHQVDFPIKPGETRFDLSYTLPPSQAFTSRMAYPDVPTRLVVPAGVTVKGDGLESLGQDPSLRAAIFQIKGRSEFALEIAGTGSLRAAAAEEDAGPSVDRILPRVYDRLPWILVPAFAALILGFILLYRTSPAARPAGARPRP